MVIKAERKKMTRGEVRHAIKQFEEKLKAEKMPVKELVLFGSYATGEADRDSDIDVAVVLPSSLAASKRKKLSEIAWWAKQINVKLEPHPISTADLGSRWLSLPAEIRRHGLRL